MHALVRDVRDFPKPGIVFKDITPLLASPEGLREVVSALTEPWQGERLTQVVAIESRGFLLAAPVAVQMGVGVTLVRKPGKLPRKTLRETYALEYGSDAVEMHEGALSSNDRVVVIDDVLATGGTAAAVGRLVQASGATLVGYGFLIELGFLGGRTKLPETRVHAVHTVR
jgi:adenine phosphoribosyltransferase